MRSRRSQVNLGVQINLQFVVKSYSLGYIYIVLAIMNMNLIYLIISELTLFYLLMFLIILFLVYFDYMLSVVRLE